LLPLFVGHRVLPCRTIAPASYLMGPTVVRTLALSKVGTSAQTRRFDSFRSRLSPSCPARYSFGAT
jgi:hypothetical protein